LPPVGADPILVNATSPQGNKLPNLIQERERIMAELIVVLRERGLERRARPSCPARASR
jgi:hypothetical protein